MRIPFDIQFNRSLIKTIDQLLNLSINKSIKKHIPFNVEPNHNKKR